ncbi:MAG TPA: CoA-binding protein [Bacteroidota bacterium]
MNQSIENFIRCRRIAVVGASRNPRKFGHAALRELGARGYDVVPVHPSAETIAGIPAVPHLADLAEPVEAVLIVLPPEKAKEALREAASAGVKDIWLQHGAESPEVVSLAADLGLTPVTGKCILKYAPPVGGFHAVHRTVTRLLGRL